MPGFPLANPIDANKPELQILHPDSPSRLAQSRFCCRERMPSLQNAAENGLQSTSETPLPIDPIQHQVSSHRVPPTTQSSTRVKDTSGHSGAEFTLGLCSVDSEHDLAAMVHDFIENGSFESDFPDSSDGESNLPCSSRMFETLQALRFTTTFLEREIWSALSIFLPSVKDVDLTCVKSEAECKGACIQQMVMNHLRFLGYDAAICSCKWQNSGKVPGGEYEYVDVVFKGEKIAERLIVDVDFQSQFQIARPTHSYATALKCLPVIFVGSEEKLRQILQVMAEAAKLSLRQNSMPLPPWRTLDYMLAKWMSPTERRVDDAQGTVSRCQDSSVEETGIKQCVQQLKILKLCMVSDPEKYHAQKPLNLERNRRMLFASRPFNSGFAVS